jgi:tRNA1Val (adenine37-N6)-methyltransferase
LMLAQRSNAEQIDALEIDEEAYEQSGRQFWKPHGATVYSVSMPD